MKSCVKMVVVRGTVGRSTVHGKRLTHREQYPWITARRGIERLAPGLKNAADCRKILALSGRATWGKPSWWNVPPTGSARRPYACGRYDSRRGIRAALGVECRRAIGILESRDDIKIMFTDINMPGSMDGIKLAQAVRGRWPPIKIIVTSAFSMGEMKLLPAWSQFIPKPYNPAQISYVLHSLAA
jgi:CheY-like chemotaxis protein